MIPSTVTAQAARERHADFRRTAAVTRRASVAARDATPGEATGAIRLLVRSLPRFRGVVGSPRPA